ncbi:hypothetical protein DUI87_35027 [Hirundo rustica rustica]|uniref:Uncharacterized protein n=1 Tax=Hirundo rustica rustica TaxID=333673 RepID=A0A3M0J1X8_HIRRU|nr:hypothetical protein DUI87_35027 [Hirundo rustica rustica]
MAKSPGEHWDLLLERRPRIWECGIPAWSCPKPSPVGNVKFLPGAAKTWSLECEIPAWSCPKPSPVGNVEFLQTGAGRVGNWFNILGAARRIQGNQTQRWSNSGASLEHPWSISRASPESLEHPWSIPGASPVHSWSNSRTPPEHPVSNPRVSRASSDPME